MALDLPHIPDYFNSSGSSAAASLTISSLGRFELFWDCVTDSVIGITSIWYIETRLHLVLLLLWLLLLPVMVLFMRVFCYASKKSSLAEDSIWLRQEQSECGLILLI